MPITVGRLVLGEISNDELNHTSGAEKKSHVSRMSLCVPPSTYDAHPNTRPYPSKKRVWPNQKTSSRRRLRRQGSTFCGLVRTGARFSFGGNKSFVKLGTRAIDNTSKGTQTIAEYAFTPREPASSRLIAKLRS